MKVNGEHYRTIWLAEHDDTVVVKVIDQRQLPHAFAIVELAFVDEVARAIQDMTVRGAGLIGATAGYGMYLAAVEAVRGYSDLEEVLDALRRAGEMLLATRPTAVNLAWAVERQLSAIDDAANDGDVTLDTIVQVAKETAQAIADEDADFCRRIGEHGLNLIQDMYHQKRARQSPDSNGKDDDCVVNILTHCNAGWLAFCDYGSATAPIYAAHELGVPVHVWVDETRPRNQGASLTAWELLQARVPHTVIVDNAGGHLMQHGMVDLCIVGSDRTTSTGDVANKIGTYLKALAANDNHIPFYVALPSSTIDWKCRDGIAEIPIEQRDANEVKYMRGKAKNNHHHNNNGKDVMQEILITPEDSPAANYAFDVTPARLVTALITERGICQANEAAIRALFPETSITNT